MKSVAFRASYLLLLLLLGLIRLSALMTIKPSAATVYNSIALRTKEAVLAEALEWPSLAPIGRIRV